jgi:thiol:disulfide interchange protein DsbD
MLENVVPDFYPLSLDDIIVGRTQVTGGGKSVTLRTPLSAYQSVTGPRELRGVLVYQVHGEGRRAGTVSIPLSKEFCATIALVAEKDSQGQEPGSSGSLLDREFSSTSVGGSDRPFLLYIVYAILGGLLLNIMPCVLPVIGLKVFGLLKLSGDQPRQVKKLGWFFSLGILASFLALALVVIILKAASEQVGWGFQFQEPLFVIVMSAVVFAFGLNLFGVYEIQVPHAAVSRVGSAIEQQEKKGKADLASFGEGVFATILATPCTAPILGTALGFAFAQSAGVTLLIFGCTALGMALPYLLLTIRPAWMKFLPKPGEWMVSAREFMGFLMMATLLWLLYILGKQLGMEAVIWTGAFLLVVGVSCWLVGRFATLTATRVRYLLTWAVAALLMVLGYAGFVSPLLEARALLAIDERNEIAMNAGHAQGIQWRPFSLAKLESYLREKKTVFIDFTAEWCLTCKVNEKTVMADTKVIEKFRSTGIVAVRADWTNRNPEIAHLLSKFGRSGVPLYVILPADRPYDPIVLPEVITPGIVLGAIDRAFAATSAAQP